MRAYKKQKLTEAQQVDDEVFFFCGQTFVTAKEVKDKINLHSIQTRRKLQLIKNDKQRIRARCVGIIPVCGTSGGIGLGTDPKKKTGPLTRGLRRDVYLRSKKEQAKDFPWLLYVAKDTSKDLWSVRTLKDEHKCLQSREVKACDYKFLSKQILDQVQVNPDIPIRVVQDQLTKQFEVQLSMQKALREKKNKAEIEIRGDHKQQYTILRDYVEELQKTNPNTTVRISVQTATDPSSPTRVFKRMYICLGTLKEGYKVFQRELLGLDGAFMRGYFPGQLLTPVCIDSNNRIYPLAYAVAEAENKDSWIWFLECLADDLDLQPNSNYTFISDRQKGIIPALAVVFPSVEHIFCLRHIHENMKLQWSSRAYKEHLWRCAAATTVQQFEATMLAFKSFSEPAHAWLIKIPPTHWSRSHFSGRAHSDVLLNNMCEVFNGKLVGGRHQPIITALEYIREYCMQRIVNVVHTINKCAEPLTPKATHMLDLIKKEAYKYTVLRTEGDKYQVSGWGDKCFVNVEARSCTCRRWELTGMPCKHVVATNRYMRFNGMEVGSVESWVHPCYLLKTWEETYKHHVQPIKGYQHWKKSNVPTTILPPKHHKRLGRPRKKRTRAFTENDDNDNDKDSKLSQYSRSVVCGICGNAGHNKKTCLGQGGVTGTQGSTHQSQKTASSQPKVPSKKKTKVKGNNFEANEQTQCQTDAQSQSHVHETCGQSKSHSEASVVQPESGSQVDVASGVAPKQLWNRKKIIAAKMASPQKNVG